MEEVEGEEKVVWKVVDGAHEFPITKTEEVVREIVAFWEL